MLCEECADLQRESYPKPPRLLIDGADGLALPDCLLWHRQFVCKLLEGVWSLVLSAVVIPLSAEGNHHPFNTGHLNQPAEQCDEVAFAFRFPFHHIRHISGEVAANGEAFDQLCVSGIEITLLVSNEANNLELPTATM